MFEHNMTSKEALKKAQEMGYAEADPSKDINGMDTLYKIFILASLGFRGRLDLDKINYSGINQVTLEDINLAKRLNYRIKLLATARKVLSKVDIRVRPVLINKEHLLSNIHGADNGIFLTGNSYGNLFLSGPGAGGAAAGSMIVSDIVKIVRNPSSFDFSFLTKDAQQLNIGSVDEIENSYLFRIKLKNNVENLKSLKKFLLEKGLSPEPDRIIEIKQEDNYSILGLITPLVEEGEMKEAIKIIEGFNNIEEIGYLEIY
jgi:homoserine dehydrogenase